IIDGEHRGSAVTQVGISAVERLGSWHVRYAFASGSLGVDENRRDILPLVLQPGWDRQVFAAQEGGVEELRLVAGAIVRQDRHDGMPWPHLAGQADGAGNIYA